MNPQITIKHNIGNTLKIANKIESENFTYLSDNVKIGDTSIPVENAIAFPSTGIIMIGSLSDETTEIITYTAKTDTSITIPALKQNHQRGSRLDVIGYDAIQVYKSSTIDGTYTQLGSNIPIEVTQMNTIVNDTIGSISSYYKVRWFNSSTLKTSDFTEPISVESYPVNSAGEFLEGIRIAFGIQENDAQINAHFLLNALHDARTHLKSQLFGVRQPWQAEFNKPYKVYAGANYIQLPKNIEFSDNNQSVLAVRFLTNNILTPYNMQYVDKKFWNQLGYYSVGGFTTQPITIGDTVISLDSVGDFFQNGGGAIVATTEFDQETMQINYTDIDVVNNQLTGVTGITRNVPTGTQVWSRASLNQPTRFTVFDGRIYFNNVIPDAMQGRNCYVDYYKKLEKITDLYEVIPEDYRESYKPYIRWAIKYRKDNKIAQSDPDYVKFENNVKSIVENLYLGQEQSIIID